MVGFCVLNPDFPENLQLAVRRVQRDEDAIKRLSAEVARFMDEVRAEADAFCLEAA